MKITPFDVFQTVGEIVVIEIPAGEFGMSAGGYLIGDFNADGEFRAMRKVEFLNRDKFIVMQEAFEIAETL